ncbi:hypothetical protein COO91_00805 [Nostoc flagelliforme CCNUN1]|uniref:Uncharacterized protein n=1 Tax=Nostoc flagelliforme CCNUN1 TaxID=2038116 RepID=A0A2K8SI65_9NOSO|nr:hypothetical protein COO91_00805 [Nostoc flagelliforme CCNUN1]
MRSLNSWFTIRSVVDDSHKDLLGKCYVGSFYISQFAYLPLLTPGNFSKLFST